MPLNRSPHRVTQKAIAERLGVRQATVSRVLAGSPLIAEATRLRVLAVATELGYRPNLAARGIRSPGSCGSIAYAISTQRTYNIFEPALVQAVEEALRAAGQHCVLASIEHERLDDATYVSELLSRLMADGLLLAWVGELPRAARETMERMHVPTVQINAPGPTGCVRFADRAGAAEAARQLSALGHRRIAFLDCTISTALKETYFHYSNRDRWQGFAKAVQAAGGTPSLVAWPQRPVESERVALLREVLRGSDRPTAVLCYGYEDSALPLVIAARDLGLAIPGDLSVATFAARVHSLATPPLAHVYLDQAELGRQSVAMLLAQMAAPGRPQPSRELALPFVPGASLAPPRG